MATYLVQASTRRPRLRPLEESVSEHRSFGDPEDADTSPSFSPGPRSRAFPFGSQLSKVGKALGVVGSSASGDGAGGKKTVYITWDHWQYHSLELQNVSTVVVFPRVEEASGDSPERMLPTGRKELLSLSSNIHGYSKYDLRIYSLGL